MRTLPPLMALLTRLLTPVSVDYVTVARTNEDLTYRAKSPQEDQPIKLLPESSQNQTIQTTLTRSLTDQDEQARKHPDLHRV